MRTNRFAQIMLKYKYNYTLYLYMCNYLYTFAV